MKVDTINVQELLDNVQAAHGHFCLQLETSLAASIWSRLSRSWSTPGGPMRPAKGCIREAPLGVLS